MANSARKDPNITKTDVRNFKLPLFGLPTQCIIVAGIEVEQVLVNANRELIRRMAAKVKATIDRLWGVPTQACDNGVTTPAMTSLAS